MVAQATELQTVLKSMGIPTSRNPGWITERIFSKP